MSGKLIFGIVTGVGATLATLECMNRIGKITENSDEKTRKLRATEILKYGAPEAAPVASLYTNHVLNYNQALKIPSWVAEHLTKDHIKGDANRRHSKFKPDPSIPEMFTAQNKDYWKSGWSRGHMAPAGDNKFSQQAMNDSFYLSNVLPQDLNNNGGFWNRFEIYCRDLTSRFEDVRIISGPIMMPINDGGGDGKKFVKYQLIGKSEVAVPTHLYKVIVAESTNKPQALAAFIVPNIPISYAHPLKEYKVPLEAIEAKTGFKMLPKLDRKKTVDLCNVDSCELMDFQTFELYFIGRKLESARTIHRLEKVWKELEEKKLKPDQFVKDLYARKKMEIEQEQRTHER